MKLSDLINELFESPEMAEYLISHSEELTKYQIFRMICMAPIDIRRKAEILAELAERILKKKYPKDLKNASRQSGYWQCQKIVDTKPYRFNFEYVSKNT